VVEEGQVDVEELEQDFERLHASNQGLFEKVDRIFAGQDKILARFKYICSTNLAILPIAMLPHLHVRDAYSLLCAEGVVCTVRHRSFVVLLKVCRCQMTCFLTRCVEILVCDDFWCKDCATKVGISEDGVCAHCGRNTSTIVEDQS
jgi:hypothetical protein